MRQTSLVGKVVMSPSVDKHLPELILPQLSATLASVNILCLVFLELEVFHPEVFVK